MLTICDSEYRDFFISNLLRLPYEKILLLAAVIFRGDYHPRNEAVSALKSGQLEKWKREKDYHHRSLSETGMYRYEKLLSPQLALRDYDAQVGEALANVKAMNKVIRLGMPVSYRVE